MGKLVLGLAAPHNPNITSRPESMTDDERHRLHLAFDQLRRGLSETSPDALLVLTTDHMTNFFYHNNPMFCLGISDTCKGPAPKEVPALGVRPATLKVETDLAKGLLRYGIENEIDFSSSEEMLLDHAYMVPLSFVTPQMDLPIVPLHVGGMLSPAPTSRRCFAVGQKIGEFIRNHYDGKVAILASGSLYSDVGGPTMGSVDTDFDMEFLNLVKGAQIGEFAQKVTPETLERAGVATELLAWVMLLGILGPVKPSFVDYIWGSGWSSGAASMVLWK